MRHFNDIKKDKSKELLQYLKEGKTEEANRLLNDILMASISFYDNYEAFYHGFITGLFNKAKPISNRESGNGRFDLGILDGAKSRVSLVFEFKYSKSLKDMETDSIEAVNQIKEKKYNGCLKGYGNEVLLVGVNYDKKNKKHECVIESVEM